MSDGLDRLVRVVERAVIWLAGAGAVVVLPFIAAMVLLIALLIAAPDLALWLPEQMW